MTYLYVPNLDKYFFIIGNISTIIVVFAKNQEEILEQFCFHFLHDCIGSTMIAMCPHCQSNSCDVNKHEDPLREEALLLSDDVSPSLACKHLCHEDMKNVHGILGKNSQKSLNA